MVSVVSIAVAKLRCMGFAGPVVDAQAMLDRVQPRGGDVLGSACARWPTSAAPRRQVRWMGVRSRTSKGRATALARASIDGTPTAPISFKGRFASSSATSSLSRFLALGSLSAGVSGPVYGWTAASLPGRCTAQVARHVAPLMAWTASSNHPIRVPRELHRPPRRSLASKTTGS